MNKIGILHLSDIHISEDSIPDIDILIKKLIKDIELVKEEQAMNIDVSAVYKREIEPIKGLGFLKRQAAQPELSTYYISFQNR